MNVSQTTLHFAASIWLVVLYNTTFFQHVITVYPLSMENAVFLASLVIGLTAILLLLLTVIGWRSTTKPVLTVLLLLAATGAAGAAGATRFSELQRGVLQPRQQLTPSFLQLVSATCLKN